MGLESLRPTPLKELAKRSAIDFDASIPLQRWLRSAELLKRQGDIYRDEGDLEMAYILLLRYANLVVTHIPKHPEYRALSKSVLTKVRKDRAEVLDALAVIKNELESHRLAWDRQTAKKSQERERTATVSSGASGAPVSGASRGREVYYNAHEDFDLQKEMSSLRLRPSPTPPPPPLEPPPSTRRKRDTYPSIRHPSEASRSQAGSLRKGHDDRKLVEHVEARTEGGLPLRLLYVPLDLIDIFLDLAASNTKKGIETAGVLCGQLKSNVLRITTLLIPKQKATSDTCTTMNEEELFDYQDKRDLITLGWIHTHPTQTCFMSSLDLHTQLGYQVMLSESIAIVCAPRHDPDYTIFRLTDPPGLSTISACKNSRTFHPHPEGVAIYTDASDRGHVRFGKSRVETVDLRGN